MVGDIAAQHVLPREVVDRVSERTGGVPLFVEEVTRLLVERGEQGGVQAIPPTLQQSLAARLDRLGPAREVAQIGAVLGRDFAYPLLRDIAEADESALQASLDRLADADLLFVEGAPPQANYRFKHALIQDAAYESLLKSRRQTLHARAAQILRESASPEPEAIAHHFTQAGLDDLAIEWWGKAGDQALRRSAFQEAIAHLGKAIAMADKAARRRAAARGRAGRTTDSVARRLGNALIAARGYGARKQRKPSPEPASRRRRQGRARTIDGRLRTVGRQLHAWRAIGDEGARRGFPQRRRARPDSPEAGVAHRARGHALVRRRVSRSAGSSGTRARPVPTRPRRRSGLSLRK